MPWEISVRIYVAISQHCPHVNLAPPKSCWGVPAPSSPLSEFCSLAELDAGRGTQPHPSLVALTWTMWKQIKEKLVLFSAQAWWVPAQTWFCAAALTERCFLSWQDCNYSTVLNNWVDTLAPLLPKELSLCCPLSVSTREKGRKNIFTSLSLNRRAP